ncbi:MAG: hypothetical protein ACREMX_05205 [Gemmatimonadales bacterium]
MYLVELRPGKEELYRTGDDLAAAIRSGDVDAHSRIYHRATSKWISITLHPQYKAIVAQKATEPLPPLERNNWTFFNAQSEMLGEAAPQPESPPNPDQAASTDAHPWRRPLALSVTGLFLIFGIQLAFSGPRPPWSTGESDTAALPAIEAEAAEARPAPDRQVVTLAGASTSWGGTDRTWTEYEPEAPAKEIKKVPSLPSAPKIRIKALGEALPQPRVESDEDAATVEGLLGRYGAAYDSVKGRLGSGIRVARLSQLFAPTRLTPNGGVTDTRLGLAGVANFIRVYRQQEIALEREYQQSFNALSKEHRWSQQEARRWNTRTSEKEPSALASLTGHLLASLDSLFGVLDAQAGAYRVVDGTITFEDRGASREYGTLRKQVNRTLEAARAAGGSGSAGPMGLLLHAIGTTQLPREI